ncbi:putative hydrolase [Glarea lozoyensis 74030]|uniref:Putative hydrolase n=1 Tax=Glarea lozoyensis (strain ATCC 74030 / MF5533) TaxID=1104152 RepID=H0EVX2_GLAL7|nr:putative hydrolase [Glarea lozoyensis 74030]
MYLAIGIGLIRGAGGRFNQMLGENYNLMSFDPRGVNATIPKASCYGTAEQRAEELVNLPFDLEYEAWKMYAKAENGAKACDDTMGEHGWYINTPQTAADMNSILDAIGQEKMYYWGGSYGTTLGQTYAQMFPERVARLVIDGVSNLDEWYNSFVFEEWLEDTDKVFYGFIEECYKAGKRCPLNSVKKNGFKAASELQTFIDNFLDNLEKAPIPVYLNNTHYGAITRQGLVANGIFPSLYMPLAWPFLASNLAELLKGNTEPAFLAYSSSWLGHILTDETNNFVIANDNWNTGVKAPVHGLQPVQNFTRAIPQQSKLVSKYRGFDIYRRASWSIPTTHNFHPHYYPAYPKVKTAEPILVVSLTWDLVCPLASAKKAFASFEGAGFVEQKSYGHCSTSMPSLCTAKHVRRYFDEGVLPEKGATCGVDGEYFPGPDGSSLTELSEEDAELLEALEGLAAQPIFKPLSPAGSLFV